MDWNQLAKEAGIVINGTIAGLDIRHERTLSGIERGLDVVICPAGEADRRIAARSANGSREPSPERINMARAFSADPYVGTAMIVRAVIGRWTVLRGWSSTFDRNEMAVVQAIDHHLESVGIGLGHIARSVKQIPHERIAAPAAHADPADAATKAFGQFVRQVDGRTVIVFSQGPGERREAA